MLNIRIGHGYDVHKLVPERKLILAGVDVPHEKGLLGHSDADVVLHALMDAMLGAAALGDIGKHFPDTDGKCLPMILLERVCNLIKENGYVLSNADITIIAQKPKLAPFIQQMIDNIAGVCGTNKSCINVKATTEEKLGFTGRQEGISTHAVVLLEKIG